ncbi:MAG TPA: SRPBCC family protein [Gemmatimonadales bacterium]|nr:SRPBCC family protein [Gemmatimonadales bacterium]
MNYRSLLTGLALGAGMMYLLDPGRGSRRRALIRDKAVRSLHKTGDAMGATARDVANRARGAVAGVRSRLRREDVPDEVLVERVRAALGRVVSHPHAITVTAYEGRVTLQGPVLEHELDPLLDRVSRIRGVESIENLLVVHESAGREPSLQGGRPRESRSELFQNHWSPTTRMIGGIAGAGLVAYGLRRRGPLGTALGTVGATLLTRAAVDLELKRLVGVGAGRRAVLIRKHINIAAPVDRVFAFWDNYENFPRFMTNVREVRDLGGGRSHWVVSGPAGVRVEWDAVLTERIPGEVIAWKTEPGEAVGHAGLVRFSPTEDGGTRVDVRLSYDPPAGALGHAVATLFGADPKRQIDEDLVRMKTLIETGVPPRDAARRGVPGEAFSAGAVRSVDTPIEPAADRGG